MSNQLLEDARDILDSLLQVSQNTALHQRITDAYVNVSRGLDEAKKEMGQRDNLWQQQLIYEALKPTWAPFADVQAILASDEPRGRLLSIRALQGFESFELINGAFEAFTIPISAITNPANEADKSITLNGIQITDEGKQISFGPDDRFYSTTAAQLLELGQS